jgi:hypothetical protein
VKLEKRN